MDTIYDITSSVASGIGTLTKGVLNVAHKVVKPFLPDFKEDELFLSSFEKSELKHKNNMNKDRSYFSQIVGKIFPGKEEHKYEREKAHRHRNFYNSSSKNGINIFLNTNHDSKNRPLTNMKPLFTKSSILEDDNDDLLFPWFSSKKTSNIKKHDILSNHSFLRK